MTDLATELRLSDRVSALEAALGAVIKVGMWLGAVNTDRTSFKQFMDEVRANINKF